MSLWIFVTVLYEADCRSIAFMFRSSFNWFSRNNTQTIWLSILTNQLRIWQEVDFNIWILCKLIDFAYIESYYRFIGKPVYVFVSWFCDCIFPVWLLYKLFLKRTLQRVYIRLPQRSSDRWPTPYYFESRLPKGSLFTLNSSSGS